VISTAVPTTHGEKVTISRFMAVRSDDCGQTWGEPFEIPFPYVYCSGKINPGVCFEDGTLAFGFAWDRGLEHGGDVFSDADMWGEAGVMISSDDGRTWAPGETVSLENTKPPSAAARAINGLDEPALKLCRDGSLYMLMRSGYDRFYASRSGDCGRTWTQPERTGLIAHDCPACVCGFTHPDGRDGWVVVYNHSPLYRYPVAVAASMDEGQSWSPPLILSDIGEAVAYPACVQTADGNILLVWQHDSTGGGRSLEYCLLEPELVGMLVE
jgi:hypothetical protein